MIFPLYLKDFAIFLFQKLIYHAFIIQKAFLAQLNVSEQ